MSELDPAAAKTEWQLTDGYRRYALGLMVAIYVVNFIDRNIFSILIEPIKAEIHLTDTQLGFLGGISFAIFYTFLGIPIARWADKGNRRNIVCLALLVWSTMTAVTGLARNFWMLLVARIGVAVGEAGCTPPIHSLISDYFPAERRATALSIYSLGIPIGGAFGTLAGGWIGEYFGWRTAFLVVGLPGLLLALLTRLTLRELPRGFSDGAAVAPAPASSMSMGEVLHFLWGLKSFRHLSLACALNGFIGYGVGLFTPSFFIRSHGLGLAETSTWLFVSGLTGMLGTFLGGFLGDRFGRTDKCWYMWIPAIALAASIPLNIPYYTTSNALLALALNIPFAIHVSRPLLRHDAGTGHAGDAGARLSNSAVHPEHHRARTGTLVRGLPFGFPGLLLRSRVTALFAFLGIRGGRPLGNRPPLSRGQSSGLGSRSKGSTVSLV